MIGAGTALVRLEVLAVGNAPAAGSYAVQVGAFRERSAAERLQQSLRDRYVGAFVEPYQSSEGVFYRVRVGPRPSVEDARRLATQLGNENLPAFVVRLNN
jgi:cell division septation protein DedD